MADVSEIIWTDTVSGSGLSFIGIRTRTEVLVADMESISASRLPNMTFEMPPPWPNRFVPVIITAPREARRKGEHKLIIPPHTHVSTCKPLTNNLLQW